LLICWLALGPWQLSICQLNYLQETTDFTSEYGVIYDIQDPSKPVKMTNIATSPV